MAEENKIPQTPPAPETPKAEAPVPAPAANAEAAPAAETKAKEAAAPTKVTPTNCVQCNKSIKKIRWYYRDGKYYCTKRCWITAAKKAAAKPAEGQAADAK